MSMPVPEFLIHGLLVRNTTVVLYAAERWLKTFLTLDMSLCLTYGNLGTMGMRSNRAPWVISVAKDLPGSEKNGWLADNTTAPPPGKV